MSRVSQKPKVKKMTVKEQREHLEAMKALKASKPKAAPKAAKAKPKKLTGKQLVAKAQKKGREDFTKGVSTMVSELEDITLRPTAKPFKKPRAKGADKRKKSTEQVIAETKRRYLPALSYGQNVSAEELVEELKKRTDCTVIGNIESLLFLIKKVVVTIPETNKNSVFQPHDFNDTKTYGVLVILAHESDPRRYSSACINWTTRFTDNGARYFNINDLEELDSILKEVK
jgi:hypothetical protein